MGGFPIQGRGGGGGPTPPGQIDVVERLFETTVVTPTDVITATISPAVNFVDYAEFWLIITGSIETDGDVIAQINSFSSSEYGTFFSRIKSNGTIGGFANAGTNGWFINNTNDADQISFDEQLYAKIVVQGGPAVPVDGDVHGSIFSMYRGTGAGNSPAVLQGSIEVQSFNNTTLQQFVVSTDGSGIKFNAGTKVSVFGVKTE